MSTILKNKHLSFPSANERLLYQTRTMCPACDDLMPGKVIERKDGIFVTRDCPQHGYFEALICSDLDWYANLHKFDVRPTPPKRTASLIEKSCPDDCGLCPAHRQIAGTAAIEISNKCNANCPACLANNQGTFELTVKEVKEAADNLFLNQDYVDAFTLSGGEPAIHPQLFEIIEMLESYEGIGTIVMNSNGLRIAKDDEFLKRLAQHKKLNVCLHYDGHNSRKLRGISPEIQQQALNRLCEQSISVTPLILSAAGVNDHELGELLSDLLVKSSAIKSVILSMMTYTETGGSHFPGEQSQRLTITGALDAIEKNSNGILKKADFMPLPMPNPLCAAIGYFL